MLKVSSLVPADWNYKNDDDDQAAALLANIRKNGQLESIIVRPISKNKYEVVNGNHRLKVFGELGMTEVMCCDVGDITLAQAKLIALETNETRFTNNEAKLSALLKDIALEIPVVELAETLPMSLDIIQDRIASVDFSFDDFKTDGSKSSQSSGVLGEDDEFRTVTFRLPEGVADQLEQQIDRFKKALNPDDYPDDISPVMAIEAICQHLNHIPDDQLI